MPKTLQEAVKYFSDKKTCIDFVASLRWADGVAVCPNCEATETSFLSTRNVWKCKKCKKQFSVKLGTIFEDSPIGLDKWLVAIWLIANAKNGISSYEIHRALGITQKSAWFVLHRIRTAMDVGSIEKMSGTIEADETFIGGLSKNMHAWKRKEKEMKTGSSSKTAVFGMVQRGGKVRAKVVPNVKGETLIPILLENVEAGCEVFTDLADAYNPLRDNFKHAAINHSIEYVRENVHTNSIENFWSLMKRTIKGTYVSVAPEHLQKYVEEQSFRYNERKGNDQQRFFGVIKAISGKRLTYNQLIGLQSEGH